MRDDISGDAFNDRGSNKRHDFPLLGYTLCMTHSPDTTDTAIDSSTPASPSSAPMYPHGDALLDGSGSRHGSAPETSRFDKDSDQDKDQ